MQAESLQTYVSTGAEKLRIAVWDESTRVGRIRLALGMSNFRAMQNENDVRKQLTTTEKIGLWWNKEKILTEKHAFLVRKMKLEQLKAEDLAKPGGCAEGC